MKQHVVKSGWTAKGIHLYNECYHAITKNRKDYGADFDKAFTQHITNNASCESDKQKKHKTITSTSKKRFVNVMCVHAQLCSLL